MAVRRGMVRGLRGARARVCAGPPARARKRPYAVCRTLMSRGRAFGIAGARVCVWSAMTVLM
jgi:hypothetical protein